jgi:hypothetical protein
MAYLGLACDHYLVPMRGDLEELLFQKPAAAEL